MNQLGRALRMTLKYKWSLVGSFVCSLLVAILWGANLGAVYPFVEIVLQNKTLPQWSDERIEDSQRRIAKHKLEILALRKTSEDNAPSLKPDVAQRNILALEYEIKTEQSRLAMSKRWAPTIKRYAPTDPFRTLMWLMMFMFAGTLLRCACLLGNMVLVDRAGHRTVLDLQQQAFSNVLSLESHETKAKGTSDLISRIRGETATMGVAIRTLFGKTIREPLKMIACLSGAAWVNWRLLILSVLVCPLAGFVMAKLAKATKRAARRTVEQSANMLDRLYQALSYRRVVKAFVMEEAERQRFKEVAKDIYRKRMRISWLEGASRVNNELLGVTMITFSVLAGGYLALTQQTHLFGIRMSVYPMDFGSVMMFFGFLIGIADPLRKLGDVYNLMQTGVVAANRVFPLIDHQAEISEPAEPVAIPNGPLAIQLDSVHFEYVANSPVLRNLSLDVRAGSSVAIVGHNGCGKSTLINLLPRFLDPCGNGQENGSIRVGGIDLKSCSLRQLRQKIGYVTQNTMLFNDTIANNIAYGSSDATLEQIMAASQKAHAFEFIQALDEGFDTVIGDQGNSLSGGQRQRISLARAILKNPEILILDEATSQIDPASEKLIHQALAEFMKDRTTIMITHRLSTLDLVDQIVIMKDGEVVEQGTHEQLLACSADYRRLRNVSLEGAA